jgi:hypothetical protein
MDFLNFSRFHAPTVFTTGKIWYVAQCVSDDDAQSTAMQMTPYMPQPYFIYSYCVCPYSLSQERALQNLILL